MATATTKRSLDDAQRDAILFREMFAGCFEEWTIAGSVRRRKPEVSDIEHVVIPAIGEIRGGLFGESQPVNLLWQRLDELEFAGKLQKHVYTCNLADGGTRLQNRWGELYRGVDFNGFNHEIFSAERDNLGSILAIRTGPADFSKAMVERMLNGRLYRQQGGHVVHVKSGERVPTPDEKTFFNLCCTTWLEPEKR